MGAALIQSSDVAIYATQLNLSNAIDNALVGQLLAEVSDMARMFCDREWWITPALEMTYGKNGTLVKPKNVPIKGVTQVTIGNGYGNWHLSPVATDPYGNPFPNTVGYWNDERGIYLGGGWRFTDSRTPNVYLTYTSGYASLTGASSNSFTFTALSFANNNANFTLPSPPATIAVQGTGPAPTLTPATTGGTLATGTYYVIYAPILWSVPFATPAASLLSVQAASGGPLFNATLGPASAQASVAVTGPTASISATGPVSASPPIPILGWLWGLSTTSGGPYTVAGLSTGQPDYGSIPQDLKQALIKELVFRYQEVGRIGIKGSAEGGQQTASYNTGPQDPQTLSILLRWRRTWGAGL